MRFLSGFEAARIAENKLRFAFFGIPIVVLSLYIWMALRSGCAWLFFPTHRLLIRKEDPAGYWAVIGAAALLLAIFVAVGAYAAIRAL